MLVGGVAKDTKQASLLASILYFPMLVFSGMTLPLEIMPRTMQKIVSLFPLTQGITMMKNAFIGADTASVLLPVCVMLQSAVRPSITQTGSSTLPVPTPMKAFFIIVMPCVSGKRLTIFCIVPSITSSGRVVPEKTSIGK